jgi:hypothetical protein
MSGWPILWRLTKGNAMATKHRRCDMRETSYTSAAAWRPPICVMCGEPVTPGHNSVSFYAPSDPEANEYGRLFRHAQATSDGVPLFRAGRGWSRAASPRKDRDD